MIVSPAFEVSLYGSHNIILPDAVVAPFLEQGHSRVEVVARYKGKQVRFHGALRKRKGMCQLIFGKRHQQQLGIFPNDFFELQLREDTTAFGVEMPEELEETFRQWPEAFEAFLELSGGSKRSVIYAIFRYRTPEARVEKALLIGERLVRGIRETRELIRK